MSTDTKRSATRSQKESGSSSGSSSRNEGETTHSLSMSEIEECITKALSASDAKMKSFIDGRFNLFEQKFLALDKRISEIESSLTSCHDRITDLESKYEVQCDPDTNLQKSIQELKMKNNDLEQYMRRSNLRIFGLDVKKDEDCAEKAATYLADTLDIPLSTSDIEVAHIIPAKKKSGSSTVGRRKTVILVRFGSKATKETVLKRRTKLKGSGVSIADDLTSWNMDILRNLRGDDQIENTWSWMGKLYCKFKSSDVKVHVRPFESVNDLQNKL